MLAHYSFSLGLFYGFYSLWTDGFPRLLSSIPKNPFVFFNSVRHTKLSYRIISLFSMLSLLASCTKKDHDLEMIDKIYLQEFATRKQHEIDSLKMIFATEQQQIFIPQNVTNIDNNFSVSESNKPSREQSSLEKLWDIIVDNWFITGGLLFFLLSWFIKKWLNNSLTACIILLKKNKLKLQSFFDDLPNTSREDIIKKIDEIRRIINEILRKNDGIL